MNWIELVSAIGLGALATKVLDIMWLQKALSNSEKRKWLRVERLRVYTKLTEDILSLGKNMKSRDSFSGYALASEAMLLVENEDLAKDIENYFTMLGNLFTESRKHDKDPSKKSDIELEDAYKIIFTESRRLVLELRKSLHEKT